MSAKVCSHRGCCRPAPNGLGWGLSTGMVQWFCADHFTPALARMAGLVRAVCGPPADRRERAPSTKAA
jgi:hypothetical protein